MMANNNFVPEIRFKGFTDDWTQRKLGEVSDKSTEKNINNLYTETFTNSAEFGIIRQRDFFDKDISNEKNLNGYYVVYPDYFVYNPRISNLAPVGPVNRNSLGRIGVMSPLYYVFCVKNCDFTFLEKYFCTTYWHKFMKLNGDNGVRADRFAIKDSVFQEMPIPLPSTEEQTAIGTFFRTLDNAIHSHQQKLNHLRELKKGYLQLMFPQDREIVPKVRFAGFDGDWLNAQLGDIVEFYSGLTYSPDDVVESGGTFVLRSSNVQNGEIVNADNIYVTSDVVNCKNVEIGDIVVVVRNGSRNLIGKHAQIKETMNETVIGAFMTGLRSTQPRLINALLDTPQFDIEITKNLGATINQITVGAFKKMTFAIPSQIAEQAALGGFFSNLDNQTATLSSKLEQLKQLKAAYLQRMFM
ncbi:MAG: restriction endonuclease subunit S [Bacteroidales bacterium]|nr:restriction endonuclease subunit S [Bacteroidales bacterium]